MRIAEALQGRRLVIRFPAFVAASAMCHHRTDNLRTSSARGRAVRVMRCGWSHRVPPSEVHQPRCRRCCDTSSAQRRARHFEDLTAPVLIASAEAQERWGWGYVDAAYFSDVSAGQ